MEKKKLNKQILIRTQLAHASTNNFLIRRHTSALPRGQPSPKNRIG